MDDTSILFQELANDDATQVYHTHEFLNNVPVLVSAEVARKKMRVRDILSLRKGSTIAFDKILGEPIDMILLDNSEECGNVAARGEIVVLNERLGLRINAVVREGEKNLR